MTITLHTILIICPLLFCAGFVDAIGGGGGLISLPAYIIAGLPAHTAVATNKLSSTCGTTLATIRFIKNGLVNIKIAIPSVFAAILGSSIGANLSLAIDEKILEYVLFIVLPIVAFVVLNKKLFKDTSTSDDISINKKTIGTAIIAAFFIGIYDGFYGPGTGTFIIIAFTIFAKLSIKSANAHAKVINLTTNITSLAIFLLNGKVFIALGLIGAVCNMCGGYLGAGLVISKGSKAVKPIIILVLILLFAKLLFSNFH